VTCPLSPISATTAAVMSPLITRARRGQAWLGCVELRSDLMCALDFSRNARRVGGTLWECLGRNGLGRD
jgi:hypothetical protein